MSKEEYPKVHTEFFQEEAPAGYWVTTLQTSPNCYIGWWSAKTKEESIAQMEEWQKLEAIRNQRIQELNEWRAAHWWRRFFNLTPKRLRSINYP